MHALDDHTRLSGQRVMNVKEALTAASRRVCVKFVGKVGRVSKPLALRGRHGRSDGVARPTRPCPPGGTGLCPVRHQLSCLARAHARNPKSSQERLKSEARNSKQARSPKARNARLTRIRVDHSFGSFEFPVSDLFRVSNFAFHRATQRIPELVRQQPPIP